MADDKTLAAAVLASASLAFTALGIMMGGTEVIKSYVRQNAVEKTSQGERECFRLKDEYADIRWCDSTFAQKNRAPLSLASFFVAAGLYAGSRRLKNDPVAPPPSLKP